MIILVFSWRDPKHPLAGGAEQVMHEHMKGWVSAGHRVVLFASRFRGSSSGETIDGVEIVRRGSQYFLGVQLAGFLFYLKNRDTYDLVVDQFHGMPFFTPVYVRKPILAVIQETAREVWFLNYLPWPLNWVVGLIGYLIEPFVFLLYKHTTFMTGSESAKRDVIRFGIKSSNIVVVPHGVLTPISATILQKEKVRTIIFLGRLSKDKGFEDALKCFAVLDSVGEYQFWVVGKPETKIYEEDIEDMVVKLNLKNKIRFWGHVSNEQKFTLLSKAHLLINPSRKEGWGLVNIEANIVGTPVVAYKNNGLIDSVSNGKSGVLCDHNTPHDLARIIDSLVDNTVVYRKLQKGAIEWSRRFSWKASCEMSVKLLNQIASSEIMPA